MVELVALKRLVEESIEELSEQRTYIKSSKLANWMDEDINPRQAAIALEELSNEGVVEKWNNTTPTVWKIDNL
jgi:Mn-dependent DtxR family transcriptional regulator